MAINYLVNFTVQGGTTVSGGFAVNYSNPANPSITGVNISITPDGNQFTQIMNANIDNNGGDEFTVYLSNSEGAQLSISYFDASLDGVGAQLLQGYSTSYSPDGGIYYDYTGGGSIVSTDTLACFVKDTLIGTIQGFVSVDALKVGSLIQTIDNRYVAVTWIGKQRVHGAFAKTLGGLPICITAGALGNGLPLRDLYVSPDHAMYIDNCVLVHAKALVNGTSIYQVTEWNGDVAYFHIETENHEIILAEGAPAETFVDNVSRKAFYNYAEYEALYPNAKPMVELDIPRVKYARQLPMAIKKQLEINCKGTNKASARFCRCA